MATSLADINATLGVTNIALSGVAKEQKETNTGIQSFIKFLDKREKDDATDRRRDIEKERETKTSISTRVGNFAGAVGGAAKTGVGALGKVGKSLSNLKLPLGFGAGFLTSLLGSKALRFGIAGLGVMFGDEIAEYLTGPDAKQEVKDTLGGAIKGGALGFLLGPRFAAIGFILGGLLENDKVDKEGGRLLENLKDFEVKFPKLSAFFGSLGDAVGGGIESINNLLEGTSENKLKDITNSMLLVGGVAALFMPGKILGLLAGASRLLMATPAGIALLALAGGGLLANKMMGNNVTEGEVDPTAFGTGALITGAGLYAGKKGIDKLRGKPSGGKVPDVDPSSKSLKSKGGAEGQIDKGLMKSLSKYPRLAKFLKFAGRFGGLGTLIGIGELINMAKTGNLTVESVSGLFGGILGGVGGTKLGALIGSIFPGPGTIIGGLLGGGLGYLAGDTIAKALGQWFLGKEVDAFGFGFGWVNDLFNQAQTTARMTAGRLASNVTDFLPSSGKIGTRRPDAMDTPLGRPVNIDPTGNVGGTAAIINNNSGNTNISNTNQAALFGNSSVVLDMGDQILVGGT